MKNLHENIVDVYFNNKYPDPHKEMSLRLNLPRHETKAIVYRHIYENIPFLKAIIQDHYEKEN